MSSSYSESTSKTVNTSTTKNTNITDNSVLDLYADQFATVNNIKLAGIEGSARVEVNTAGLTGGQVAGLLRLQAAENREQTQQLIGGGSSLLQRVQSGLNGVISNLAEGQRQLAQDIGTITKSVSGAESESGRILNRIATPIVIIVGVVMVVRAWRGA